MLRKALVDSTEQCLWVGERSLVVVVSGGVVLRLAIDADMTAVRLTPPFPMVIVGSPEYLRARGAPESSSDLREHACLRLRRKSDAIATWRLVQGGKPVDLVVNGPLIANDYPTLVGAACDGLGLAQLPEPMVLQALEAGLLVRVLPKASVMTPGVFLYHPGRRQVLPKLRAFIDQLQRSTRRTQSVGLGA